MSMDALRCISFKRIVFTLLLSKDLAFSMEISCSGKVASTRNIRSRAERIVSTLNAAIQMHIVIRLQLEYRLDTMI